MGLFNKKQTNEQENRAPRNPNNVVMFRVLAVGYVGYLCIQMVKTYTEGGPDAPSLPMLIGGLVLLGGGALFLAILTYKEWKINKVKYDSYMSELRAEAEAKRALEETEEEPFEPEVDDDTDSNAEEGTEDAEDDEDTEDTDVPAEQAEE